MNKRQIIGLAAMLAVTAVMIGTVCLHSFRLEEGMGNAEMERLAETGHVVDIGKSPDGRFEMRAVENGGQTVGGGSALKTLEIIDCKSGEVRWKGKGGDIPEVMWSPDSCCAALAYGGRTGQSVKFVETRLWTEWDFTLPDGSAIPEGAFLPENWVDWEDAALDQNGLRITIGNSGGTETAVYRCFLRVENDQLVGDSYEEAVEVLPGDYDFDHDGESDIVELATTYDGGENGQRAAGQYVLTIRNSGGARLWMTSAHLSHPGWTSVFACKVDGKDYLLQLEPEMCRAGQTILISCFIRSRHLPAGNLRQNFCGRADLCGTVIFKQTDTILTHRSWLISSGRYMATLRTARCC